MSVSLSLLAGAGWQFFTDSGTVLSGGLVYTYAAGTSTPQTTYTSATGLVANSNPIVLNAAGRVAGEVWLTDGVGYKFVVKTSTGATIGTYDNIYSSDSSSTDALALLAASSGSSLVGFINSGTGATARTVQAKLRDTVSVKDFGAVGDGVTDDTAAIQAALDASLSVYFPTPSVSYRINDSVSPRNNTTIYGDGLSSHIQLKDGSINGFYLNGVSGVVVRDLKISTISQTNSTAYKGGVLMANECRNCLVEDVGMFNMGYWGVAIYESSNCVVRGCRFSSWFGTVQDSAQIAIQKTSNNNLIEGNYCLASSEHGILIQDPYTNSTPTGNSIINNHVANARYAGIIAYVTTAYDTQTLISGNRVFDISGTALGGLSGHGIYIQSTGGTVVTNNTLTNCCGSTTGFETQVVAAIGVSTGDIATYPTGTINEVIVSNNHITAQRGPGISVQTCGVPVQVEGNIILSTGTTAVRGEAIYCANADGVQIKNNTIKHLNTNYSAISINSSGGVLNGVSITGNRIRGTTYGISFNTVSGGTFTNAVITSNIVSGLSNNGLFMQGISGAQVSNNNISSTGIALALTSCPNARFTANRFYSSSGSYSIAFSGSAGASAGTIVDESNDLSGVVLNEAANGTIISKYGNAAPASSGYWGVGDRVVQSVSVVGQPKGWRCTVAGNPGTWVSEGNL